MLAVVLCFLAVPAFGADSVESDKVVSDVLRAFTTQPLTDTILEAAKSLFWSLAVISLVWTMGMLIVRHDIGEMLMELLRFIVVTGLFYWILVNASSRQGGESFVDDIVLSFLRMISTGLGDETVRTNADSILSRGLDVYLHVLSDTGEGQNADRLIIGGMAVGILCICTVMAGQVLLALVMAWILGYAGIFLLGFGGSRWTSPIAVNYYKHVVAVGAALLTLSVIGTVATALLDGIGIEKNSRNYSTFVILGMMLVVSILMLLLSIKIPQLIYTLVTGSTLGMYAGSASAAGTAIATAGSSAYATATGRLPGGGGGSGGYAIGATGNSAASHRSDSVMDAVQRSASAAGGMADPFHISSGADPFGVGRASDPHRGGRGRSVFGDTPADNSTSTSVSDPVPDTAMSKVGAVNAMPSPAASTVEGRTMNVEGRRVPGTTEPPALQGHGVTGSGTMGASSLEPSHLSTPALGGHLTSDSALAPTTDARAGQSNAAVPAQVQSGARHDGHLQHDVAPDQAITAAGPGHTGAAIHPTTKSVQLSASADSMLTRPFDSAQHATIPNHDHTATHVPLQSAGEEIHKSYGGSTVSALPVMGEAIDTMSSRVGITPERSITDTEPTPAHAGHRAMAALAQTSIDASSPIARQPDATRHAAIPQEHDQTAVPTSPAHATHNAETSNPQDGASTTGVVQEDMKSLISGDETVEMLPGATVAPAEAIATRADASASDTTDAQPLRPKKRRVRRWEEPASTPLDGPVRNDDESPPEEGK
ncbi:P-type conjugative transfer protein TrbL [Luteibacter sp.]|uniref:P-type conjugative transfer protein TrbL n=1 Tax=Luteibacter sp. TaxID=1886636 RepID=UPI002F418B35